MCWALIGGAVTLGIMLWTFAPWIPVLRETVPGVRRMRQLEVFWTDGRNLERERVTSDEQFKDWHSASWGWRDRVERWLSDHLSPVEADVFRHPNVVIMEIARSFHAEHNEMRCIVRARLAYLLELRDAVRPR